MKQSEIKKLTKDQAMKNIDKLKKDLFNFRFQKINSQITNPAKINETKKTIIESLNIINSKISTLESNYFKKLKAKVDKVLLNETIKDS